MSQAQRPWRVVLVEDNPDDRIEVKSLLLRGSDRPFVFADAATGRDGLRLCHERTPDCLILDFDLPDMTAVEILGELPRLGEGDPPALAMPVVVLTGSADLKVSRSVIRAGAHDFVSKEWLTADSLNRAVENAAERLEMSRELRQAIQAARRAQEELVDNESRLRLALESSETGMWDWDLATDAVRWSPECYRIHGLAEDEFDGTVAGFAGRVHGDDAARLWDAVHRAIAERERYELDFRVVLPDGGARWVTNRGRVVYDAGGKPLRMVGITVDLTERKAMEARREQILEAERWARAETERLARTKDEFLATLSHELRTPLNAIVGWAEILKGRAADPHLIREGVEVIARNAQVQAQLIADLLDMNRILSGKLRMDVVPLAPNLVAAAAAETVRTAAEARGLRLVLQLGQGLPSIHGDSARLQQVLWNLLSNAIKFTPKGGTVTLSTEAEDGGVRIVVQDNGRGLDAAFVPRLFDRFSQADASAARQHGGLGLGLSIVKHLVDMHGGTVTAASEGPGRGACFTVTLPVASEHAPASAGGGAPAAVPAAAPAAAEAGETSLAGLDVLLVDDQPDALDLARRLLCEAGAEVATAASAQEALDRLGQRRPDALVSDIGMPEMDGFQLIQEVRERLGWGPGELPAVALTAYARQEDCDRALAAGYQAHLTKPLRPQLLVSTLASLVGKTGLSRDLTG